MSRHWMFLLGVMLIALPGSAQRQDAVAFRGVCVSAATNISGEIVWESDQQGVVGYGASGVMYLKAGKHRVTASCRRSVAVVSIQANRAFRGGVGLALSSGEQFSVWLETSGG